MDNSSCNMPDTCNCSIASGEEIDQSGEVIPCRIYEHFYQTIALSKHAMIGGRLVAVAREENGDGGSSAEVYGSEKAREDGLDHGGEVVLDIDD
ncbi:unnamed protein product [Dovyalis caffra]|uniref:Uncharacterized protein n=1 Tax=Dovyalis caffra TaxID=77055 RepID=A0AAV1SSY4_9ROSI|nr:unnamed protein product [Dovyalis caffra]